MSRAGCVVFFVTLIFSAAASSQTSQQVETASCSFQDGKQISIRYQRLPAGGVLRVGQIWPQKQDAILLFTDTNLEAGGVAVPLGAYALFLVPQKDDWRLVVSRPAKPGSHYDPSADLVRAPMETATGLKPRKRIRIGIGRMAPVQCELRISYGKTMGWISLNERTPAANQTAARTP